MREKPMTMYGCINLLDTAVQNDIIQRDPENKNNIMVYFGASEDGSFKEGWYSCNLMKQAEELLHDKEGQQILLDAIHEKVPDYKPPIMPEAVMHEYNGDGRLFILTGMSASGKDTALNEMVENGYAQRLVSTTTRPMREGEVDGVSYNFISREAFEKGIESEAFLEYRAYDTLVNGVPDTWYYGSPKQELSAYKDYVVVLDMQGAKDFADFYGKENSFIVNVQVDDAVREERASSRGSFDKTEWDRRLADDKVKFSDEIVGNLANFVIKNENRTIDELVSDIRQAADEYFKEMDKDGSRDIAIVYDDSENQLFKAVDRAEFQITLEAAKAEPERPKAKAENTKEQD